MRYATIRCYSYRFALLAIIVHFIFVCHALKVRVGHIGAVGYMKNGKKILEISRKELWKDGVLDKDFDIE
ncbi:unnamed protein product [Nippostrongylus brasiliensis]|uniref:Uncharacterized protein n=1 Tax=Nippostrongylus brasiliensis TaxID=27835 RepID=A0A0N4XIA7_NIPBR|nr:unnamed protein product [Nippostrongylus brasiliensis]VDL68682.1 unnamed protein product [Nippostrongylus brasiliensis]